MVERPEQVGRQREAAQSRPIHRCEANGIDHRQIGVGDGRLSIVIRLEHGAIGPVPAGVEIPGLVARAALGGHLVLVLARAEVLVAGHDVRAEKNASLPAPQKVDDLVATVSPEFAHHPLACAAVQMKRAVSAEKAIEEFEILRPATQVSRNPGTGESLDEALERVVVAPLAAVSGAIRIARREPGVRISDMGHEGHPKRRGEVHGLDAGRGVEPKQIRVTSLRSQIDPSWRRPELHDAGAPGVEALDGPEKAGAVRLPSIRGHEVGHRDESDAALESLGDGVDLAKRGHRVGQTDAEEAGHLRVHTSRAGSMDVRVHIDDRVAQRREAGGRCGVVERKSIAGIGGDRRGAGRHGGDRSGDRPAGSPRPQLPAARRPSAARRGRRGEGRVLIGDVECGENAHGV